MSGLWRRYRGWPRWAQILTPIAVIVIVIVAANGSSKKKPETPAQRAAAAAQQSAKAKATAEKNAAAAAKKAAENRIVGKIAGTFDRSCDTCYSDAGGDLESRLTTSDVWCAWQHGHVIVHVTMHNRSVEHITVQWLPTYQIRNGGIHGNNILFPQNSGFDAGQTRSLLITQKPAGGIPANSPLAACQPAFQNIKSG